MYRETPCEHCNGIGHHPIVLVDGESSGLELGKICKVCEGTARVLRPEPEDTLWTFGHEDMPPEWRCWSVTGDTEAEARLNLQTSLGANRSITKFIAVRLKVSEMPPDFVPYRLLKLELKS